MGFSCTMYVMKRYTSSQVRERLSDVLDAAERGEEVVIERRGARFFLRVEGSDRPAARRRGRPAIEILDPAVAKGGRRANPFAADRSASF